MTDAEKKELKEKNVEADSSDNEQFSRMPAVAFEDRSELNKARSLRRSKNSIYEIARRMSLIISQHLPLQVVVVMNTICVKKCSVKG